MALNVPLHENLRHSANVGASTKYPDLVLVLQVQGAMDKYEQQCT